jgi:DNA-directed RNA polymerase specialized sigma24 family protein
LHARCAPLPDRFRELLTLREFEGLSYREVAGVAGMPMGSVMSGLSRARQAFRGAMSDEWRRSGISRTASTTLLIREYSTVPAD